MGCVKGKIFIEFIWSMQKIINNHIENEKSWLPHMRM